MKKIFWLCMTGIFIIISAVQLCGCNSENVVKKDVKEKLISMNSYLCTAKINAKSNKNENNYLVNIIWEKGGKYKIKTNEPETLNGNIILFDGKGLWQYNPNVQSKISLMGTGGDFDGKSKIFISEFMKSYLNGNNSSDEEVFFNGKRYLVLYTNIGEGKYFAAQKLWIDIEEEVPFRLQTFDDKNNVIFSAEFSDFKFDGNFSDDEFREPLIN